MESLREIYFNQKVFKGHSKKKLLAYRNTTEAGHAMG